MAAIEVVRARIDADLKRESIDLLSKMGLSVSDAIRMLLVRVVADKALPFDVRIPNAETQAAIRDGRAGKVATFATFADMMADLENDDED